MENEQGSKMRSENENKSKELVGKFQIILDNFASFLKENSPFNDAKYTNILAGTICALTVCLSYHFKKQTLFLAFVSNNALHSMHQKSDKLQNSVFIFKNAKKILELFQKS